MSIYIEGMDMPKKEDYFFLYAICSDGEVCEIETDGIFEWREGVATARQIDEPESCYFCSTYKDGDSLFAPTDLLEGIGFDYIGNIHFCPRCGRKLRKEGDADE